MRRVIFTSFLIICFLVCSFNTYCQENIKIRILKGLFSKVEIDSYKSNKFISAIARNKFASIPLSDGQSKIVELNNGLYAFAFNIFLSDKKSDYKNMLKAGIYNFMDINEADSLWHLTENERLIQVIIFDLNKNKFIAKAENFPIEKLKWNPTGMGDLTQYESLSELKKIEVRHNSFYIRIDECPDCQSSYYFFNPESNKLSSSEKFSGCIENIKIENSRIIANKITNCYEATYNDEEPIVEKITLLKLAR